MDTRLPHFPGRDDFLSFLRFLDNRAEYERYLKGLDEKIVKFTEVTETFGKASEIDRLHEKAEAWVASAKAEFTEREERLKADEAAFKAEQVKKRQELTVLENASQERLSKQGATLHDRDMALQDREKAIGAREAAAEQRYAAAEKATQEAQEAKREADEIVKRIKAAAA